MKEIMIKTIKEDITYMLAELGNMRKAEVNKDTKNKLMENSGLSQDSVGYRVYFKDFRPYRKMVDSLSKLYDSLNQMYKYNMLKGDEEFVEYIVSSLFAESKELHKLMETCKEDYDQYRCMSDAYVKLTDKICRIERDMPYDLINQKELLDLEASLNIVLAESEDIVNIAESLGILTEKHNYQNALYSLSVELDNWIGKVSYPIKISKDQRNFIKTLFSNVQGAKGILVNKISSFKQDGLSLNEYKYVKPMYIDCVCSEGKENDKVIAYVGNELIAFNSRKHMQQPMSIIDYAEIIHDVAIQKGYEIFINTQGFGMSLYDHLIEFGDLKVSKLIQMVLGKK